MLIKRVKSVLTLRIRKVKRGINMEVLEMCREKVTKKFKPSIFKMESFLGINKTTSITPSPSDLKDKIEKGDCFADWYKEELEDIYEKYNNI